jgi:hypothetical protein
LAKPAHIGLDYAIVFGSTEDMQARVRAITDVYSPAFEAEEAPDVDDIFTQAPFLDPSSPDTRLSAYGKVVGEYFEQIITASQYSNLASDDFRAEYRSRGDGNYELISDRVWDVILVDANGNPTGEISRARAILAPNLVKSWEIKGDTLEIFELD